MTRYYLIPFETDANILRQYKMDTAPKYINLFPGDTNSIMPKRLSELGQTKVFLRNHYLLKIEGIDDAAFAPLDAQTDVIHITRQKIINNRDKLEAIGINTTGLTLTTPVSAIQKRLLQWLIEDDTQDFTERSL